jgi:peptide/nickel transport system substrate-binding protein
MKRHKWMAFLALCVVVAVTLTACGAPAGAPAAADKVLVAAWVQEFDTLNPLYTGMWFVSVTFELWNCSPWIFDEDSEPVPVMVTEIPSAENGGISEDGLTITFSLRDDMTWQDGEPITSADFIFGYEMAMDPGNAVSSQYPFDQLVSMEAPDDYTVVMTFAEPFAPWLAAFSYPVALPEHVLRPAFEAEGTIDAAEWNLAPTVGCGPFQFDEWESGSFARFVAWDGYWMGRPNIDQFVFQFVPDDAAMIAALVNGDADLGTFFAYSDVPTLEDAGIAISGANSGYNEGIFINMDPELQHPALADANVRRAIAMGIDRETIVNDLLLGLTRVAVTPWEGSPAQDPALEPYPYDPVEAAALLDAAGWTDTDGDGIRDDGAGTPLSLTYGTNTRQVRQDVQAVVQQQLAEIGVGVELLNYDSDIYFATYGEGGPCSRGELDLFEYSGAYSFPDPDRVSFDCSEVPSDEYPDGSNDQHLCDPDLDALLAEQRTIVDAAARTEVFYEITGRMYDQTYWIGMWYDPDLFGVRDTVTGVRFSGADPFFNVYEWDMPAETGE